MTTIINPKQNSLHKRKTDYYQIVTNKIIALLDQGTPPWRKTWGSYGPARNYASGHVYRGINYLMLNLVAPYNIPLYMSKKQIEQKGGHIKKGSKAEWVYFYGDYYKDERGKTVPHNQVDSHSNAGEELTRIRFLKTRPVYNVSCIEGIEIEVLTMPVRENTPIDACEDFLRELSPRPNYFETNTDRAYYRKDSDTIHIPEIKYFDASEAFYNTLFHEVVHWTGHISRLDRAGITSNEAAFGTKLYAEEELIAELGASYLCSITGIGRVAIVENSAAYIQSWKARLQQDKKLIFRVAARAQQAVDYLIPTE